MTLSPHDRLAALLSPELIEALDNLIAERIGEAMEAAGRAAPEAEWIDLGRAAELLGCSVNAVRMRGRRGRLDVRYQGRRMYVSRRSVAALTASRPVTVVQGRR